MKNSHPKKIFIEKDVAKSSVTQQILHKLPDVPVEYIDDYRTIKIDECKIDDVFKKSKECLAIARKKGELVKQFKCRDGIIGNTEYYISHGNNCSFDCEYCFLQSYFDNAIPTLFVNHDEILNAVKDVLQVAGDKKIVFHAGELCDALAFDGLTDLSLKFISLFSEFPNARLELRTKTTTIDNLLNVSGINNIVVSWTFSPQVIVDAYEHKTPSLEERISAAEKVQRAGCNVGICLDPIIMCEDWFNNYKAMLEMLFDRLDIEKIKFVSLGGFRYLPSLAKIIRERNPQTNLLLGEFVPCIDGKHRYFRPIRVEIYREIGKIIGEITHDVKVSLCMETREVWNTVKDVL
ncbi:MAG: DNA repair photoproduct lyase [Candidatus Scalindua rubra]|uniref:DNA repair photoproduct lyase n=1 Tax=Candidatus Scalindua rubra TaxID=1872076 RepID=A0A1E3X718_9BACT|nr:MAG: DNA repair photoproduct lyase [Candidatus Scalindua rubra]